MKIKFRILRPRAGRGQHRMGLPAMMGLMVEEMDDDELARLDDIHLLDARIPQEKSPSSAASSKASAKAISRASIAARSDFMIADWREEAKSAIATFGFGSPRRRRLIHMGVRPEQMIERAVDRFEKGPRSARRAASESVSAAAKRLSFCQAL